MEGLTIKKLCILTLIIGLTAFIFLILLFFNTEKADSFKGSLAQKDFKNFENFLNSEVRSINILSNSLYNFSAIFTLEFYLNKLSKTELLTLKSHLDSNSENISKFLKNYDLYSENVSSKFFLNKNESLYVFGSTEKLLYPFFDETINKDTTLTETLLELSKNDYTTYISTKNDNNTIFIYIGKKVINHNKCRGYIILKSSYNLDSNIKIFTNLKDTTSFLNVSKLSKSVIKKGSTTFFVKTLKKENKNFYLIEFTKSSNILTIILYLLILTIILTFIIIFYTKKDEKRKN